MTNGDGSSGPSGDFSHGRHPKDIYRQYPTIYQFFAKFIHILLYSIYVRALIDMFHYCMHTISIDKT